MGRLLPWTMKRCKVLGPSTLIIQLTCDTIQPGFEEGGDLWPIAEFSIEDMA